MDSPEQAQLLPIGGTLAEVRQRKLEQTQLLLGGTIGIDDTAWQQLSRLPGWTRAHVATHLARNADGFRRCVAGLREGRRVLMYDSDAERERAIEQGSVRTGLELQIDLDTSAGALNAELNHLADLDLDQTIELRGGLRLQLGLVPVARLNEIVLHHIDLDCGYGIASVPDDVAEWLLQWHVMRLSGRADVPAIDVAAGSGFTGRIGASGNPTRVAGSDRVLLGWLTGRGSATGLTGAEDLALPLLA